MAQAGAQPSMDIQDQQQTFSAFLSAVVWTCTHVAQVIALATIAFAIGAGWWSGLVVYVLIGIGIGLAFRMSGAFWAFQVAQWVLLALGGLIVPAIAGMMS